MKKCYLWLMSLVLAVVLTACDGASGDYLDAVPNDGVAAFKINVGHLLDKSELLDDPQVKGEIRSRISSLSSESRQLLEDVMENPDACGLDLQKPVVVSVVNIEHSQGVVSLAVKDVARFEKFVTVLGSEDESMKDMLSEKSGHKVLVDDRGKVFAAYDNAKLVIPFADANPDPMDYMELRESRRIKGDSRYAGFLDCDKDFVAYVDCEQVMRLVSYMPEFKGAGLDKTFAGSAALFSLDFEDGAVALCCHMDANEEMTALQEKLMAKPNGKNLNYVPKSSFFVMNAGLRNLSSIYSILPADQQQELEQALAQGGFEMADLDSFDGDFTIAATDEPNILFMAQCKDSRLFDKLVGEFAEMSRKIDDNVYDLEGYIIGFVDGCFFVMPESVYNQCADGSRLKALASSFMDHRSKDVLKNNGVLIEVSGVIDCLHTLGLDRDREVRLVLPMLQQVETIICGQDDADTSTLRIELADKKQNSLKLIISMVIAAAVSGMIS